MTTSAMRALAAVAVSLAAFEGYFAPDGDAWPYERQGLVKLRPVAGDVDLGRRLIELRDRLVYQSWEGDFAASRGWRMAGYGCTREVARTRKKERKKAFRDVIRRERVLGLQGTPRLFTIHSRKLFNSRVVMPPIFWSGGR